MDKKANGDCEGPCPRTTPTVTSEGPVVNESTAAGSRWTNIVAWASLSGNGHVDKWHRLDPTRRAVVKSGRIKEFGMLEGSGTSDGRE